MSYRLRSYVYEIIQNGEVMEFCFDYISLRHWENKYGDGVQVFKSWSNGRRTKVA